MDGIFVRTMFEVGNEENKEQQHLGVVEYGMGAACAKALWQGAG